jgi:thioredoxin reductase (NADPH)
MPCHKQEGSYQSCILKTYYTWFPEVLAGDLVDNLMEQIKQFEPGFTLGERAETIEKQEDGTFIVTSNKAKIPCSVIAIAGGLGSFEPRNH